VRIMLLKIPGLEGERLERRIHGTVSETPGHQVFRAGILEALPAVLSSGLIILGDAGGGVEELIQTCQQLHARREPARTHLLVLTSRGPAELKQLAEAGADEFVAPPGEPWEARLIALERRLALDQARPLSGKKEESLQAQLTNTTGELERTRDFLRNTLDALPDPLFVKDRQHRWVAVNSAFSRLLGLPAKELLGKSDGDFVPADQVALFWKQDDEVFRTGRPLETEQTYEDVTGSRFLITKKAPFTGADGEPFLVVSMRDVTDRRRLEMQLRLADRMASVGTLAAGVAHEINNPLAYVTSNLSYLSEELARDEVVQGLLPELRQAVSESLEGAIRVRDIVQDLRTFARAADEEKMPVDVQRAVDNALHLLRGEFSTRARLERWAEPVPTILGSESRLEQLVVNLLKNALQSFPERPAEQNLVRVSTRSWDGWVLIEVEDNGRGMEPKLQERIFDPFFTTRVEKGRTGLGLSISLALVQLMGGRIEVHSMPGKGSLFRVVLPAFADTDTGGALENKA
jgi:two-component system NtrC family sensor kinase